MKNSKENSKSILIFAIYLSQFFLVSDFCSFGKLYFKFVHNNRNIFYMLLFT